MYAALAVLATLTLGQTLPASAHRNGAFHAPNGGQHFGQPGVGRWGWDHEGRFDGHYWGGWDRHVYRGAWFVVGPVDTYDPYAGVWVYVWEPEGYVQVKCYYNTNAGLYWYYGSNRAVIWLR